MEIDKLFEVATNHARNIKNVSERDMLKLYGLYKHVKDGPCNTSKPYMWDFTAKAKWENWKAVIDLSNAEAKKQYIDLVRCLDPKWTETVADESPPTRSSGGLGVSVSIMSQDPDEIIAENDKTVFDWCREGHLEKLKLVVDKDKKLVESVDMENLTLLHWAVDLGYLDIASYLLQAGCNINCQDGELQTPLHYAVTCDHVDLVDFLLKAGADKTIKDADGNFPYFYCENEKIRTLFTPELPTPLV